MAAVQSMTVAGVRCVGEGRRLRGIVAALLLLPSATGCYVYTPVFNAAPASGTEVEISLTDRGRIALAGPLGPGARTVQGRIVGVTDSAYVLSVHAVTYIDSPTAAKWTGEQLTVPKDAVGMTQERRLSKTRSWVAAGVAVGVVALAAAAISLAGGANGDPGSGRTGGGTGTQ